MIFDGPETLTYDDVLLVPGYSEVILSQVDLSSHFARDLTLKLPILSAAMDTVTESHMARVLAQHGGLGVIHKNLTPQEQAHEVDLVKKYESGMITEPITMEPEQKLQEALELMRRYSISGVPIVSRGKLVGILTNRDLRFETDLEQPIQNLMTPHERLITAKEGVTVVEAKKVLHQHRIEKLPVVDSQGALKGLITIKDIEKAKAFPSSSKDSAGRLVVGAAIGVDATSRERAQLLVSKGCDVLVVDTAHGHSGNVIQMVKWLRSEFKDLILVAGNVVTPEGTEDLLSAGADVVKVGVGPGSICTTRVVAGVGMAQASVVYQCAKAAQKKGKTIIADGGVKFSGDICKALALGASTVMVGNLLAGSDESPGETVLYQGRTYKVYRGMGSLGAMADGAKDRYAQTEVEDSKLVPEGIEGRVPYRGTAGAVLHQLAGGLRSGFGYVGAQSTQELREKARFVRISPSGLKESHVHDVHITKEAPNYRLE